MITIDGSIEEGGGSILRIALALSMITKKPFRIINIRSNRQKPGLKQQHIVGIKALQKLSNAKIADAYPGSQEITFVPGTIKKKKIIIDAKTAAPITLILQSILPPIIMNKKPIIIELTGGTDVAWAPQIDYFTNVFSKTIKKITDIKLKLIKRGYYPKGGGKVIINIRPKEYNNPIEFIDRGKLISLKGISHSSKKLECANVSERISESIRQYIKNHLKNHSINSIDIISTYQETLSIGTGTTIWADYENITIGIDQLGKKRKSAEIIGELSAKKLVELIKDKSKIVDDYLLDQLIPYLALFTGSIKVEKKDITNHAKANIHVCEKFLPVKFIQTNNKLICVKED